MMSFDHFTERAQEAAQRAAEIIQRYGHNQIDTEHILLALIEQPQGVISQLLEILKVDPENFKERLDYILRTSPKANIFGGGAGQVFITPRVKRIIDQANEEANRLKDEYISTEHIFLAILGERSTPSARLLEDLGITRQRVLDAIEELRGGQKVTDPKAESRYRTLEKYSPTITKPDMTKLLEENMDLIAEGKIHEDSVLEESREMLTQVFSELDKNKDNIIESLQAGLREDKIIGTCSLCGNDLLIRRSKRGSRFIGCSNYPNCTFSLPLPKSGQIIVTDKSCEAHGLHHIRIINQGKRAWDLGCPHCNFIEWQKTQQEEQAKKPKKERPKSIKDIEGVGKATAGKLEDAGIKSIEALMKADAIELAKTIKVTVKKIKNWQISCGSAVEDL